MGMAALSNVRVYSLYGLGGRIWSWPVKDYIVSDLSNIKGVTVAPTMGFSEWRLISEDTRLLPKGTKKVVIGHSMGAAAATYITDEVPIDLVVCYDCAGQSPSYIGKNTGNLLDFWDRAFALVPKFRPKAVNGHKHKIVQVETRDGHTGQTRDPALLRLLRAEVLKLTLA